MVQIYTYEQIDRREWLELVQNNQTGTWFQSPEAYDFYASLPEVMRPFVFAAAAKGQLRAVCAGYVTQDKSALRQFFTRRAIILGGPCLADDCTKEEAEELLHALIDSLQSSSDSPIYIETRNFNDYSDWKEAFEAAGFTYKQHLNFHVDTTGFAERLSDNRKRQLKKSTAVVSEAANESEIYEWYGVLSELYRTKVKTPLFPPAFFIEAYRQGIGTFLMVNHNGTVIGGSMLVHDRKCVYEWFECGLNARYKDQYPSVLATYTGMFLAQENGYARYDMMGAGEPGIPYGVRDFKAEFGGRLVEHGRFLYILKPILYRLGSFGVRILKR